MSQALKDLIAGKTHLTAEDEQAMMGIGPKPTDSIKTPRQSVDYDYRELDWDFVNAMARMGQHGAQKYGNGTWRHKKMTGDADPINHAIEHIKAYIQLEGHDNFEDNRMNLAAAAFNLMLAYYHTREIKS